MRVNVRLFRASAGQRGAVVETVDLPDGTTLSQLVEELKRRPDAGELLVERSSLMVNHCRAPMEMPLKDGDEVYVLPVLGGG